MHVSKIVVGLLIGLVAGAAMAAEPQMPKAGKYCLACHEVDAKKVGPSYHSVAEKYRGNADAPKLLFNEIRSGKHNKLTKVDMPAQGVISTPDLKQMIAWILSR